jgi:type IV pilus assembly protein PilM
MIKNLFIPEHIGSYYLMPKRIIGFDIGKTHIYATQLLLKGRSITAQKFFQEKLPLANGTNYDTAVAQTIEKIIAQVGSYQEIRSAIATNQVLFKELKLPFLEHDKIAAVLPNEVAPLLPFAVSEAVIDFIITKQIVAEKSSEILVAAVQKQHLAHHLSLFEQAHTKVDIVTVDLIAFYGIYRLITPIERSIVLIDIGSYTTRLAYIQEGQLRFIRTIPQGILDQAKKISESLDISSADALEYIMRHGLDKNGSIYYSQAITQAFTSLAQEIGFTLKSFTIHAHLADAIQALVFLGEGTYIKGLIPFMEQQLQLPAELFDSSSVVRHLALALPSGHSISQENIISLSIAYPAPLTAEFNLRKDEFTLSDSSIINKGLLIAGLLAFATLALIFIYSTLSIRALNKEIESSNQEIIETIHKQFPRISVKDANRDDILREAESAINEEERMFELLTTARPSFLRYLLEIFSKIDKESTQLELEKITISADGMMSLSGKVRDYDALKKLLRDLRKSKLFTIMQGRDEPDFIINMKLVKNHQERS